MNKTVAFHGRVIVNIVLAFFLLAAARGIAWGNPTAANPTAALKVHGTIAEAKTLAKTHYALAADLDRESEQMRQVDHSKINPRAVLAGGGKVWQAMQESQRLQWMRETAGQDLQMRLTSLQKRYESLGNQYAATPKGRRAKAKILSTLRKTAAKRSALYRKMRQQNEKGNYAAVVAAMQKHGRELMGNLCFLSAYEQIPYLKAFGGVYGPAWQQQKREQSAAFEQAIDQRIAVYQDVLETFESEVEVAASNVRSSDAVTIDKRTTDDPVQSVVLVGDRALALWAAVVRAEALRRTIDAAASSRADTDRQRLIGTVVLMVQAVVETTDRTDAAEVYPRLLAAIAMLDGRLSDSEVSLVQNCESSMGQLIASDPTLRSAVANYRRATDPVLAMRSAFVTARVRSLRRDIDRSSSSVATPDTTLPSKLQRRLDQLMPAVAPEMIGKSFVTGATYRLSEAAAMVVSPIQSGRYAAMTFPALPEEITADLRQSLFATDEYPALSSEAAGAIGCLRRRDFAVVGGQVSNLHVESSLTRMASLPPSGSSLVSPAAMRDWFEPDVPTTRLLWRIDVTPRWAATEHYVVGGGGRRDSILGGKE